MSASRKYVYEERLILFLDFLGFKALIKQSSNDGRLIARIAQAITHIKKIVEEADIYDKQKVTQFSDSIVVSYVIDDKSAVFSLINNIGLCIIELVQRGLLVRGAITSGDLLHTDDCLFGPAMVQAYELESTVAKHPRVIIDQKIFDIAKRSHAEHHDPNEELEYVKQFLTKDVDGYFYIDYISWHSTVAVIGMDTDDYPSYISNLGVMIKGGLLNKDFRVQEKYLWLHLQYIAAIEDFEKTPPTFIGRQKHPEIHDAIVALPKLASEAVAARKNVARERASKP